MSQYGEFITCLREERYLVDALRELGFQPEVHETPVQLRGYRGDARRDTAHVVIPRKQVGPSSNDIGFLKQPDGMYTAIISDFDKGKHGQSWLNKVTQAYKVQQTLHVAAQRGYVATGRTTTNGKVQLRFAVRG